MLSKLAPKFIKNRFYSFVHNRYFKLWYEGFLRDRVAMETRIPKYDLTDKHIKNLKVLVNRDELLRSLPKDAVCAEIGVNEGEFSEKILQAASPRKLHLIDAWGDPSRYHDGLKLKVKDLFKKQIEKGQVEVNVGFSTDVLAKFPDHYFDWVYLDSDHTYPVTAAELNLLKDKVKPNGIITGHDYIIGNWAGDCRYGVIEAVHELCVTDNWELMYITINNKEMPSFAIRKLH